MSFTSKILLAMLLGISLGGLLNSFESFAFADFFFNFLVFGLFDGIGQIFINSLKLLVVPLVFVSLVCGVGQVNSGSQLGAISLKAISLYIMTTAFAIFSALLIASFFNPGSGINIEGANSFVAPEAPSLKDTFVNIFPSNPINSMAEGNMLQIIVFALLFGFGLLKVGESGKKIRVFFDDLYKIILEIVKVIIWISPLGVFCLLFNIFASLGISIILDLINYFLVLSSILIFHALFTYSFLLSSLGKLNPYIFFTKMRETMLFAFSTSSSSATMPITLKTVEEKLGVGKSISSFCIPLGTTINMDGTAIMQGVATVFIAQAYAIDLTLVEYLMVILTATLASIGTAGVPGVGLIMLAMVLQQVGLPVEGIALIIGVDRLLDMLRTAINVSGDAMVACVVAKSEGQLDEIIFNENTKS
ncbi:MAG: dicarboxylate/amino acid:cation symporter [Gammaproteobacteria bacterium]